MLTHTERIAAAWGLGLGLLLVIGFAYDRWVLAVWWWPLVGSEWRKELRQRKLDRKWERAAQDVELPDWPEPNPEDRTCCTHPGTGICMCDCHDWEDEPSTDDDADQMIATWRGDDEDREQLATPASVWDLWWAELDGLDRECLKVRATVEHQDRLWAVLVQETRQLCPLAMAA